MYSIQFIILFLMMHQCTAHDVPPLEQIMNIPEDHWLMDNPQEPTGSIHLDPTCAHIQPTAAETFKRLNILLPFFDSFKSNSALLQKLTSEAITMFDGDDLKDQEASFYIMLLVPLAFLQNYNDLWCLFEKLHHSLRLFKVSEPTDKRTSLKTLQNFEIVHDKVRNFINGLPQKREKERPVILSSEPKIVKDWFVRKTPIH